MPLLTAFRLMNCAVGFCPRATPRLPPAAPHSRDLQLASTSSADEIGTEFQAGKTLPGFRRNSMRNVVQVLPDGGSSG